MRDTLEEVISLQDEYSAENTSAMQRRGSLIRRALPQELRDISATLSEAMGSFGEDADAQGKDNMGRMSRIPWVRWYSKARSPSATTGWYVVYLFHPDGSGVSLCLCHGSTHMEGSSLVSRSDEEVAELMSWASSVIGVDLLSDDGVRSGIGLGKFDLAVAYERTTVFSKFYPSGQVPADDELTADLVTFVKPLAKLYRAQEQGIEPGVANPDALALKDEIERFTAPLRSKSKGQGWLSAPARKLVEMHAMSRARTWLKEQNFQFTDVSATDSFPCHARRTRLGYRGKGHDRRPQKRPINAQRNRTASSQSPEECAADSSRNYRVRGCDEGEWGRTDRIRTMEA
jgi:hypothetical protein